MTTLNLTLTEELRAFVGAQTAQEGYASADDYLRALIRDARERKSRQRLEVELMKGLEGPSVEMTPEDWGSIRREAREGRGDEAGRP